MSGRVYPGDNEGLRADGKLAGRADCLSSSTGIKHESERQAELHWAYVEGVLNAHGARVDDVKLAAHHYKTAFIHGWKHGQEDMNGKAQG